MLRLSIGSEKPQREKISEYQDIALMSHFISMRTRSRFECCEALDAVVLTEISTRPLIVKDKEFDKFYHFERWNFSKFRILKLLSIFCPFFQILLRKQQIFSRRVYLEWKSIKFHFVLAKNSTRFHRIEKQFFLHLLTSFQRRNPTSGFNFG